MASRSKRVTLSALVHSAMWPLVPKVWSKAMKKRVPSSTTLNRAPSRSPHLLPVIDGNLRLYAGDPPDLAIDGAKQIDPLLEGAGHDGVLVVRILIAQNKAGIFHAPADDLELDARSDI